MTKSDSEGKRHIRDLEDDEPIILPIVTENSPEIVEAVNRLQSFIREHATPARMTNEGQEQVAAALNVLVDSALGGTVRHRLASPTTFGDVVAEYVRARRMAAGWRQQDLADHVEREGLGWRRITVAEVETRKRRISWEELAVLSIVFKTPVFQFLAPPTGVDVTISTLHTLTRPQLIELLLGPDGRLGRVGEDWEPATTSSGGDMADVR